MSETFRCDDKEMLVAYLYGEIDGDGRREVERHLRTCAACTRETEALQGVRQDLSTWIPPETDLGFVIAQKPAATVLRPSRWSSPARLPAWVQVAAAVLVMAAGAAIANLQVHYGNDGLTVRTGWMTPAAVAATAPAAPSQNDTWKPALTALERSLRQEIASARQDTVPVAAPRSADAVDANALMRRVQALVAESEQRQRDELALRLTMAQRDWDIQRRGDMVRIQQSIGGLTGRAVRTEAGQQQMMDLLRRVSSQPIP
jgi:anti-sigma factor RsiW